MNRNPSIRQQLLNSVSRELALHGIADVASYAEIFRLMDQACDRVNSPLKARDYVNRLTDRGATKFAIDARDLAQRF